MYGPGEGAGSLDQQARFWLWSKVVCVLLGSYRHCSYYPDLVVAAVALLGMLLMWLEGLGRCSAADCAQLCVASSSLLSARSHCSYADRVRGYHTVRQWSHRRQACRHQHLSVTLMLPCCVMCGAGTCACSSHISVAHCGGGGVKPSWQQ